MLNAVLIAGAVLVLMLGLKLRRNSTIEAPETRLPDLWSVAAVDTDRLLASFDLTPRETGFFGDWLETQIDGQRVAFVGDRGTMMIVVGNFDADEEQLTEIYLTHVTQSQPLPKGKGRRLDDYVGESGQTLAMRYFKNAEISRDDPTLKTPEIRDALLAMSSTVVEFGTFETPGVEIWFDSTRATAATVESDVLNALVITKSMLANQVNA